MASSPLDLGCRYDQIYISDESRAHLGDAYNITHIHPGAVPGGLPPKPLSTVPFPPDEDYVHRGPLVDRIHDKLSAPGARVALVGLGGVGKSQLAIAYGQRVREKSPSTWVLWLYASSTTRFEQSVRDNLDQLKVPGRAGPNSNVLQLFRNWLRDAEHGKWLIILDNFDDADVMLHPPSCTEEGRGSSQQDQASERCLDYLPSSSHGSILVTSRSRDVALKIVDRKALVTVDPMSEEHAVQLVKTKLDRPCSREDAVEFARALDFMPLAITQGVAYIEHNPLCSIKQYLERLRDPGKLGRIFLDFEAEDTRRDRDARNSIFQTWRVSFNQIRKTRRSAADLLSLMSMFDRQSIPATLLCDWSKSKRHFRRTIGDWTKKAVSWRTSETEEDGSTTIGAGRSTVGDAAFEEDLKMLRGYSLISVTAEEATFNMHRLVQLATQTWLKLDRRLERWKYQFVRILDKAFPYYEGDVEYWATGQPLYPHAVTALQLKPKSREATLALASLLDKSGYYAERIGDLANADSMESRSMNLRKRLLGDEHPHTLSSMDNLANTYWSQGRLKEAEELQLKVLDASKRLLGDEHLDTLSSMNNLANTYWSQGRLKEAEELQLKVLDARKRLLGELGDKHLDTLTSMNDLANTYRSQGRLKEAEELQLKVLDARKRLLGDKHPYTLTSINNLANTYWSQGRLKEAEELQLKVLDASKRLLGDKHPDTLSSMNDLANTYWSQGRLKEAEELQLKVLDARKRLLGELGDKHLDTLTSMNDLANTYRSQGRLKEAEELQLKVLDARSDC